MIQQTSVVQATSPIDELRHKVKMEMRGILIDAAKKMNCHPEELRIRVVRNDLTGQGAFEVERIPHESLTCD